MQETVKHDSSVLASQGEGSYVEFPAQLKFKHQREMAEISRLFSSVGTRSGEIAAMERFFELARELIVGWNWKGEAKVEDKGQGEPCPYDGGYPLPRDDPGVFEELYGAEVDWLVTAVFNHVGKVGTPEKN